MIMTMTILTALVTITVMICHQTASQLQKLNVDVVGKKVPRKCVGFHDHLLVDSLNFITSLVTTDTNFSHQEKFQRESIASSGYCRNQICYSKLLNSFS